MSTTPGEEVKWFAAAKDAALFEEALALAGRSPCDPRTLSRAARDHLESRPSFALGAGLLALRWLIQGDGFEITSADVWEAYSSTMKAAEKIGSAIYRSASYPKLSRKKHSRSSTELRGG